MTLDNGESVRCTPDHLFRLRDGSYRRADALAAGDSLMPLYRSVSSKAAGHRLDGYERVWMNDRDEWVYTHYLADAYDLRHGLDSAGNGRVRHHVDDGDSPGEGGRAASSITAWSPSRRWPRPRMSTI